MNERKAKMDFTVINKFLVGKKKTKKHNMAGIGVDFITHTKQLKVKKLLGRKLKFILLVRLFQCFFIFPVVHRLTATQHVSAAERWLLASYLCCQHQSRLLVWSVGDS